MSTTSAPAAIRKSRRKTAPAAGGDQLSLKEKRNRALELKIAGHEYEEIAAITGYWSNASGAWKAVQAVLDNRVEENAATLVAIEVARLDMALKAIWPKVLRGNLAAIDRMLAIGTQRARLLGFNKPIQIDVRAMILEMQVEFGLSEEEAGALLTDVERRTKALKEANA